MDELLIDRIDALLDHIGKIENDTKNMSFEDFCKSDILIRATCFSLSQIGEQMVNLEKHFKKAELNIPWKSARDMRNIIVHIYNKVNYQIVYDTIQKDLPSLKESFITLRANLLTEA